MDTQDFIIPPFVARMPHVSDYAEIDEVLRSQDFRQGSHQHTGMFMGGSVIMLDGEDHRRRRQTLSAMFSRAALQFYENGTLVPTVRQTMEELRQTRGPDGIVRTELVNLVRIFLHRISALVTGIDNVTTMEETERFKDYIAVIGEGLTAEWTTLDRDQVIAHAMQVRERMIAEFFLPSFERRKAMVEEFRAGKRERADLPTDLLTLLLLNWEPDWTLDYIWREATFFAIASTQTTTHNFPHLLVHLTEWFRDHPEDAHKATDPDFLRLAEHESLRMHQPAPTLLRIATKDVVLSTGRKVAQGECVALLFTPANRDKGVFGADAHVFNPYRAAPHGQRPWGLTFGSGPHICIGRPLVTGQSSQGGDDNSATYGTMVRMTRALYEAGVILDPDHPPKRVTESYYDAYSEMRILLPKL